MCEDTNSDTNRLFCRSEYTKSDTKFMTCETRKGVKKPTFASLNTYWYSHYFKCFSQYSLISRVIATSSPNTEYVFSYLVSVPITVTYFAPLLIK